MVALLRTHFLRLILVAFAALGFSTTASAQVTTRYTNTVDSTTNGINETATPCATPFTRSFTVGTNYTVADVNIGVLMAHTYRGDLRVTLIAPDGTRVELINAIGGTRDNLNVLFDDSAASAISAHTANNDTAAAGTVVPPYQRTFRPAAALTAFVGKASLGNWTLEICDQQNTDSGTFYQADLYLTSSLANTADLSLTKTLISGTPASGGTATWRLTVTSAGTSTTTVDSVVVTDPLPAGFVFTSASGIGTFDPVTGIWSVGSVPVGQTRSIDISGTINASAGATITNIAEITGSSVTDPDSTPGNAVISEDDYATSSFVVAGARVAGIPPVLTCPAGTVLFDWDPLTWTPGSTSNSYPLSTLGSVSYNLVNPGLWLNNASVGGQSPTLQTVVDGGFTGQKALMQLVDLADRNDLVTTTIALPKVMQGAQFRIFDVDFGASQFADRMVIEGRLSGATVLPTLTNGVSNYTIANSAYGDGISNNNSADGNIVVTFNGPIDTIIIGYGNHAAAPVNPGQQGIALGDVTYCHPITTIGVTKTSEVLSIPVPGATNPKAIPGAEIEYCITVTNSGTVSAQTVIATDTLPPEVTYVPNSLTSGTTCATATTPEDDNNTDFDESNPFGVSHNAGTVIGIAPNLAAGATFAFKLRAVVD